MGEQRQPQEPSQPTRTHVTLTFDRHLTEEEIRQIQSQHNAISAVAAAGMVGVASIGNAIGRVFWAWASDSITRRTTFAAMFLACGIMTHVAWGLHNRPTSWLATNGAAARAALKAKNYELLGKRRVGAKEDLLRTGSA